MYAEFIGITQEVSKLIERQRSNPDETKSDILVRVLRDLDNGSEVLSRTRESGPEAGYAEFDLGQGAKLRIGERIYLFLAEGSKKRNKPDGIAEIRKDGIYLHGQKVTPSRGSSIQPAMRLVQEKMNHRNQKGELISLSAWRQWHVHRNGKLMPLIELKDPVRAHRRGRDIPILTLEDLGL
jgi:hypothetical protein